MTTGGDRENNGGTGEPLVVVAAADQGYLQPLAVMLRSVERHLDPARRLRAYVLTEDIDEDDRRKVEASLQRPDTIRWLSPHREAVEALPLWGRFPVSLYDSLAAADALPADVHRALWLDCDVLALGDIAPIWDETAPGVCAGAVRDEVIPTVASDFGIRAHVELGMPPETPYFNAGVILIDCDAWRSERVAERALDYLRRYGDQAFFPDQEALNKVLFGNWQALDERWNYNVNFDRARRGRRLRSGRSAEVPTLLHFAGGRKPWLGLGDAVFRDLYFEILDETQWRGWRPRVSLKASLIELYSASILHRWLRPMEHRILWLFRRFTLR